MNNKKNGDELYYIITDQLFTILIILFKNTFKLCKLLAIIIINTFMEVPKIRNFHKTEKYVFSIITIISLSYILYKILFDSWPLISIILILNYLFFKCLYRMILDVILNFKLLNKFKKYKGFNEIFDNKVAIININHDEIILNSFIPIQDIEKKKYQIEHYFNKRISSISSKKGNLRVIIIKFNNYSNIKLKDKYKLVSYIKTIDISKYEIPFLFGVDKDENIIIGDLKKTKHMLISGEIGAGKSTLENCIIQSLMYFNNIAFVLVDFKIVGLNPYKYFNNCFFTYSHKVFLDTLEKINYEMDTRYKLLETQFIEDIGQWNKLNDSEDIPSIVIVIDEIADIKISLEVDNNRIEELLRRIMNMGRAAGIYIIAATQRPSGVQLSTEIRAALVSKISFAIQEPTTQKMTGVLDTQDLRTGEFKTSNMLLGTKVLKGFYVDRFENKQVFEELESKFSDRRIDLEKHI